MIAEMLRKPKFLLCFKFMLYEVLFLLYDSYLSYLFTKLHNVQFSL